MSSGRNWVSLSEIRQASRQWHCSWFVAWCRLRCRRAYWDRTACALSESTNAGASSDAKPESKMPHLR